MSSNVAVFIQKSLEDFYHKLSPVNPTKQRRNRKNKKSADRNTEETWDQMIKYGFKMDDERKNGRTPAYTRKLNDKLELIVSIMYRHQDFREAIEQSKQKLRDIAWAESPRLFERWNAKRACEEMQPLEKFVFEEGELSDRDFYYETIVYNEQGRTYGWHLTTQVYGGSVGFGNNATYGKCHFCHSGLPVWRKCVECALDFFWRRGQDIYNTCLDCPNPDHQKDLRDIDTCENCWGPLELKLYFAP